MPPWDWRGSSPFLGTKPVDCIPNTQHTFDAQPESSAGATKKAGALSPLEYGSFAGEGISTSHAWLN